MQMCMPISMCLLAYVNICMYVCTYLCVCVCVCARVRVFIMNAHRPSTHEVVLCGLNLHRFVTSRRPLRPCCSNTLPKNLGSIICTMSWWGGACVGMYGVVIAAAAGGGGSWWCRYVLCSGGGWWQSGYMFWGRCELVAWCAPLAPKLARSLVSALGDVACACVCVCVCVCACACCVCVCVCVRVRAYLTLSMLWGPISSDQLRISTGADLGTALAIKSTLTPAMATDTLALVVTVGATSWVALMSWGRRRNE